MALTHGCLLCELPMVFGAGIQQNYELLHTMLTRLLNKGFGTALCVYTGRPDGLCAAMFESCSAAGLVCSYGLPILPQESHLESQLGNGIRAELLLLQLLFPPLLELHGINGKLRDSSLEVLFGFSYSLF